VVLVSRDISERKRAEQRERMEHAVTRVLAESETLSGHSQDRPDHLRDPQLGLRRALEHGRAEEGDLLRGDLERP